MPHPHTGRRRSALAAPVVLTIACLGLAACGSSSKTPSTTANAASSATATTTGGASGTSSSGTSTTPGTASHGRFAGIRECLQKNGVNLPARTPGQRPQGGGFLGGGGGQSLPKGVTRAQLEAAMKKCGGGRFDANGHFGGGAGGFRRGNNPAFRTALSKFAACMRQNGINVPAPNTSGGPIFDTKGIDTASAQFKAAESKCRSVLVGAFRRPGGPGATDTPTS